MERRTDGSRLTDRRTDTEATYIVIDGVKTPTYIATWELCMTHSRIEMVRLLDRQTETYRHRKTD